MAKEESSSNKKSTKRFIGGIADSPKEGANYQIASMFYFNRATDFRTDPQSITLLPGAVKESGTVVTDLVKWADIVPNTLTVFSYGNTGNVYSRTTTPTWSQIGTVSNSHGNGLAYFTGDDYIYLTSDSNISRYGPTQNSPQLSPNFLTAQGGVPQNVASIATVAASSQYATAADSASLEVTSDLTLESYFYANTLPTVGNSMTLVGKWNESGALRSYKMDIAAISGYFGNGSDGSLTISADTTEAPIDSACTGTAGTQSLSATNASFAQGQVILIHQTQGTGAGQWERNTIQGYTAGTITLGTPLKNTYVSGAQVRVLKQYTNVTINSGKTYTAKAWNGTVGGILAFLANGTVTITGNIVADGCGFRGNNNDIQGESELGTGSNLYTANGTGGGSGQGGDANYPHCGGGGSGHATSGSQGGMPGSISGSPVPGYGGGTYGSTDLTTMTFGGAGGGADNRYPTTANTTSGSGGGIIFIISTTFTISGTISSAGTVGHTNGGSTDNGMGGSGAGGSVLIKAQTATLGSALITALGGAQTSSGGQGGYGGAGGNGFIHLDYYTSYTGTTSPTINVAQDSSLVTTTTYQARLAVSNDGTAYEYLTQNLPTLTTAQWNRLSISWKASTSTARFLQNGVFLGTFVGTKTSISSNASLLYVNANKGASTVGNYFDGLQNDTRIWNNVQSDSQIAANNQSYVSTSAAGLQANYRYANVLTDSTANANTLTQYNSPTYSINVPFPAPTTRLDIDNQNTSTGQTYTLLTSISEAAVDLQVLAPVNDPQNSIAFYVDTKGTGDWTVTVHDQQNRLVATKTITNANIPAGGIIEFIYTTPWRPIAKNTYHVHLTVSTGTSKVVTGTTANFSTAEYTSYFGFLVPETQFHPLVQFQYQPLGGTLTGAMIIGNERYLAVWDGVNYSPNFIQLTTGWHVRCFAQWRQYLAIGVWRGGNIYDYSNGRVYFWSGYQPAYDFFIDVPDGQINAMFGVDSDLYMFAGFRGELLDYKGGYFYNTGNTSSNRLKRMPLLEAMAYTEVYPEAFNMWRGMLHFGLYANSNSVTSQRGVYSYGTLNQFYPDALSYDYPISTGNRGNTVSIGLVYPVGQNLLIGWKDGNSYGVDVVNFNNAPASSGEIQLLIEDDGAVWHPKKNTEIRGDFSPLNIGESVSLEVNTNRLGFNTVGTDSTIGDTHIKFPISPSNANEMQIGAILNQTNGTSPRLLALTINRDMLKSEDEL